MAIYGEAITERQAYSILYDVCIGFGLSLIAWVMG
jgi:hypothetical protein